MTRYERQKLRQRLTFHGSQFERGDGSSLDALLRALDLIDQVEGERDIYRRALERISETGCRDIERELSRIDAIAVDALVDGDALRDTRDLARADGGSGQSGAGAPTTPPHNVEPEDLPLTRQAGERPAD